MNVVLGFDPGGEEGFGWCVLEDAELLPLRVLKHGVTDRAELAVEAARAALPEKSVVRAAGIDAPLFWTPSGDRRVDQTLRNELRTLGAVHAWGTVQAVNSLRGACLVQGMMLGVLIRRWKPGLVLTESHPKAYLWITGAATPQVHCNSIHLRSMNQFACLHDVQALDHERDAAIAGLCAWAMAHRAAGWRNLFPDEVGSYSPLEQPLGYWMPTCAAQQQA